jgi:hypothetical protein
MGKNLNSLARFLDILRWVGPSKISSTITPEGYDIVLLGNTHTLYIEIQTIDPELDECMIAAWHREEKLPSYAGDIQGVAKFIKEQWKI